MSLLWIFSLAQLFGAFHCVDWPSYLEKCALDDTFNDCVLRSGNAALPTILKGDPEVGFPRAVDTEMPYLDYNKKNVILRMQDLHIDGLQGTTLTSFKKVDNSVSMHFNIPNLEINAKYGAGDRIGSIDLPKGGSINIIATDITVSISLTLDLQSSEDQHILMTGKSKLVLTTAPTTLTYSVTEDGSDTPIDIESESDSMDVAMDNIISSIVTIVYDQISNALRTKFAYDDFFLKSK